MASCCPPGALPALAEDKSLVLNGKVETVGHLRLYTSAPAAPTKKAVVVIYEVHGFDGGRLKGICDTFAQSGFLTVMPDVYHGVAINDIGGWGSDRCQAFLRGQTWPKLSDELDLVLDHLHKQGIESVGIVGFCWGAWVVFHACATGKFNAGASCHPSLMIGNLFHGETVEGLSATVKAPQQLNAAGNDPDNVKEGGDVQKILQANGVVCETHHFADMNHGWVPRGDVSDDAVKAGVEKAMTNMITFFNTHL